MGSVHGRAAQTLLLHRGAVTVRMRPDTATVIANPVSFTGAPLTLRAEQAWLQVGKEAAKYTALFVSLCVYAPLSFGGGRQLYCHYQPAACVRMYVCVAS